VPFERKGDIGPDRPDRGIIAQPDAHRRGERRAEIREARRIGVAASKNGTTPIVSVTFTRNSAEA